MKNNKKEKRYKYPFVPCGGLILYIGILIFALIFTQELKNPASAVFLVFVLAVPFAELIYLLTSLFALRFSFEAPKNVTRQHEFTVKIKKTNRFIFPYPFIYIQLNLPHGEKSETYRVKFSADPLEKSETEHTVICYYRGEYELGITDAYVKGLFGFLRMKLPVKSLSAVCVHPRRFSISVGKSGNEADTEGSKPANSGDGMTDVREYADGDSMRRVHWKLSAKSDELFVKQYDITADNKTVFIPDMSSDGEGGRYSVELVDEVLLGACEYLYENRSSFSVHFSRGTVDSHPSSGSQATYRAIAFAESEKLSPSCLSGIDRADKTVLITADPKKALSSLTEAFLPEHVYYVLPNKTSADSTKISECTEYLRQKGIRVTLFNMNGGEYR